MKTVIGYKNDSEGKIIEVKTELDRIMSKHPSVISSLMRLFTAEEKKVIQNINSEYIFTVRLPSVREQLNRKPSITVVLPSEEDSD